MTTAVGIESIEKLAHVGFLLAGIAMDAATGKRPNILSDIFDLVGLVPDLRAVLGDYPDIIAEFKGLDDAELQQLYTYCSTHLNFPIASVQADVQKALLTGQKLQEIYLIWVPAKTVAEHEAAKHPEAHPAAASHTDALEDPKSADAPASAEAAADQASPDASPPAAGGLDHQSAAEVQGEVETPKT